MDNSYLLMPSKDHFYLMFFFSKRSNILNELKIYRTCMLNKISCTLDVEFNDFKTALISAFDGYELLS